MPPYVFKPKTENKNTLYITPCLNVTLCIKSKNRKQKRKTRLCDRNRKNVKAVYKLKKSTIKIRILYVSSRGNL